MKTIATWVLMGMLIGSMLAVQGCASTRANEMESVVASAGFHKVRPDTPEQRACYAGLQPFLIQRCEMNGRTEYAYANKKAKVVYVGDEGDYERFKELGRLRGLSDQQLEASDMSQTAAMNSWSLDGMWW